MKLDFSKITALQPKTPSVTTSDVSSKNVHVLNKAEKCQCGHDESDHEGDCTILECACISYFPVSHIVDVNESLERIESKLSETLDHKVLHNVSQTHQALTPEGEVLNQIVREFIAASEPAMIEVSTFDDDAPTPHHDITVAAEDDGCAHLCKCGKWWSHGKRDKCRHPDLLDMGFCKECLNGAPQADVLEDFVDDKLTPKGIARCYNKAREDCAKMTQEQIGFHIQHLAQRIEELRAEQIMSRKMRAELIEEECQKVSPAEREAFRQELLRGKPAKTAKSKGTESKPVKAPANFEAISLAYKNAGLPTPDNKTFKLVGSLMEQMKKSAEEIVRFLND